MLINMETENKRIEDVIASVLIEVNFQQELNKIQKEEMKREKEEQRKQREEQRKQREEERERKKMEKLRKDERKEELRKQREETRRKLEIEKLQREGKKKVEEEKRKEKEEIKRQQELEKLQKEEKKKADEERRKQSFIKFFKKLDKSKDHDEVKTKFDGYSTNCFVKKDMYLAPLQRRPPLTGEEKDKLDLFIRTQDVAPSNLYVGEILSGRHKCAINHATITEESSSDVILVEDSLKKTKKFRCKLLQFKENYRPPYFGTWRKKCSKVNGRRPFVRAYENFNYDEDSDEEWESEPEDGEECKSDDEDDEKENNEGDSFEDDGFFVEHGYLSPEEEEVSNEEECLDPETRRERMKVKAEAWKSEKLCRKWEKLKTVIIYNNNFTEKQQVSNPYDEFLRAFEAIAVDSLPVSLLIPSPSSSPQQQLAVKKVSAKKRSSIKNSIDKYCKPTPPKLIRRSKEPQLEENIKCCTVVNNCVAEESRDSIVCINE